MSHFVEQLEATLSDRGESYGDHREMFAKIADAWSVILGYNVTPRHVALMMIQMKVLREANAPKTDNWTDIAGYSALGSTLEEPEEWAALTEQDGTPGGKEVYRMRTK